MVNTAIVTNIPAPYSVDLFNKIIELDDSIDLSVVYSAMSRKNREWTIDHGNLKKIFSLDSIIISKKSDVYTRYIHIPKGTWRTLNSINPDVLLVYEYSIASLISLLWAKTKRRKFVHVTEGTLWSEKAIGRLQKLLRRIVLRYSDFYVACSSKSKEKLAYWGVSDSRIKTILLTLDISKLSRSEKAQKKQKKELLYVGSIDYRKGIDLLIKSLRHIDNSENIKLTLAGSGSEEYVSELRQLAINEGIQTELDYTGFVEGDGLAELYRKADVFVLPTRSDCYGLVLVEAYCSGIPIVASKYADGAYDVVENGVNGLIADPFDAESFGNVISEVLNKDSYNRNAKKMDKTKFEIEAEAKGFIDVIHRFDECFR